MKRIMINKLNEYINKEVNIQGWIHRIRKLKSVTFIIIRDRSGVVQCVLENNTVDISSLKLESVVSITGEIKENNNNLNPFELIIKEINTINICEEELPIEINQDAIDLNLETILNNRILSLRHEKISSIFKIQNIIVQGFREFLISEDFTEIFTPKLVAQGAEGGSDVFEVKYFEEKAYLAQSPQFYKQMMIGTGFERVFEIGHVYRAEQHDTNRHLNEYVSMDLEIAFIKNEEEIMELEENLLKHILEKIKKEGEKYVEVLGASIPVISDKIPRMKLSEAIDILETTYNKKGLEGDLDPEGEKLICEYAKKHLGCEFIFLTHYPRKKRPMYTMPCGGFETHSFDLLFRGIEITTGGQRIHDYNKLIENIKYKGLEPKNYESYTNIFKYGMPTHGGLAIGLERITSKLVGLENIREATLITRDRHRLTP